MGKCIYQRVFFGTADFDPGPGTYNLTSAGFDDIFISKLVPTPTNVDTYASIGTSTFSVFPNPVTDNLTIATYALNDSEFIWAIADMTGKTIINGSESLRAGQNIIIIDTKQLAPGIYVLRSRINGEIIHTKIIKN